jgi:hypothetical protein
MIGGIGRASAAVVCAAFLTSCQDLLPVKAGDAVVYATGAISAGGVRKDIAIRLDRQACVIKGDIQLRDASGLGVLVISQPTVGWVVRSYAFPRGGLPLRGYLNVAGVLLSYPLARGTTRITRSDAVAIDGSIDWTLGHPSGVGTDTITSNVRTVGSFHAVRVCEP